MTEYRASLDAAVSFSNGGDLTVHGFRIDLPSPDASDAEIAALFIALLGLLMTDSVELIHPVPGLQDDLVYPAGRPAGGP